jgi:hypothetical protein
MGEDDEKKCCSCFLTCMECWDRSEFLKKVRKIFTFLFTHLGNIALVSFYCIFGAFIFELLEWEHEIEVKKDIKHIRENILGDMWREIEKKDADVPYVLDEKIFTRDITEKLRDFEKQLIRAMR